MLSRADTDRPGRADVLVHRPQRQVVGEDLDAAVVAIANVDVSGSVGSNRMRQVHLTRLAPARTDRRRDEPAVLVVIDRAVVVVAIGDEDVALGVGHDIAGPIEGVRMRRRYRRDRRSEAFERLVPPAQDHFRPRRTRIPFDDGVRTLVDRPDEVLRVDIHAMRHREGVGISPDLAHERAVLIELEQSRSVAAPGEDVHLTSGIARDPHRFSEFQTGRRLQKAGLRLPWNLRRRWRRERMAPVAALNGNRLENRVGSGALNGDLSFRRRSLLRAHSRSSANRDTTHMHVTA